MRNYKEKLSGIFIPLTTPFIEEKIVYRLLIKNIEKYNEAQIKGYMILGGNGEYLGLTEVEALSIVETVIKNKGKDKAAVVGTGRESAFSTIEFTKKVADKGAEFASIITPFYYAKLMNDDALKRYYTKIADASPIPLILYNSPGYANDVKISRECLLDISGHSNIVLMKNSSSEPVALYKESLEPERFFNIHVGKIDSLYTGLCDGAIGGTLAMANYLPELCGEAFALFVKGRLKESKAICDKLTRINSYVSPYKVPGVKYAMRLMGMDSGETRIPLIAVGNEQQADIRRGFEQEELLFKN